MDAVVDPAFAGRLAGLGGLAILNLEGVQTRYDEPAEILAADRRRARRRGPRRRSPRPTPQPVREDLIARRIAEIHDAGSKAAVAATPGAARRFGPFSAEHGADLFLVQSQVSSARHLASGYDPLSLADFTRFMPIPVAVGNTTNSAAAFALMEQGAAAVFVGVGPGRRLHDPRGPRHRRAAGHRDQRRRRRPRRVLRRHRAATCRSSPTAGCAAAASSRRRSPPAPTC